MSECFTGLPPEKQEGNQLQQRYEDLRAQATGDGVDPERRGHGLSLFLDQGMVAWMKAWNTFGGVGSSSSLGQAVPVISMPSLDSLPMLDGSNPASTLHPIELQNQLAVLLASLALQIVRNSSSTSTTSRAAA